MHAVCRVEQKGRSVASDFRVSSRQALLPRTTSIRPGYRTVVIVTPVLWYPNLGIGGGDVVSNETT